MDALRAAAAAGDARAQYRLGRVLLTRPDRKGVGWIRKSAEAGCLPAERVLAHLLLHGYFVKVDFAKGKMWMARAAGHPAKDVAADPWHAARARFILAILMLRGGDEQGMPRAVELPRQAADAGLPRA